MRHLLSNHSLFFPHCTLSDMSSPQLAPATISSVTFPAVPEDRRTVRVQFVQRKAFRDIADTLWSNNGDVYEASFWHRLMPLWGLAQKEALKRTQDVEPSSPQADLTLIPPTAFLKFWGSRHLSSKDVLGVSVAFSILDHKTGNNLHARLFQGKTSPYDDLDTQSSLMIFTATHADPFRLVHRKNLVSNAADARHRICSFIAHAPLPQQSNV